MTQIMGNRSLPYHILPRRLGGNEHLTNKQVLHRHCHDQKTAADLARLVSMTTTSWLRNGLMGNYHEPFCRGVEAGDSLRLPTK